MFSRRDLIRAIYRASHKPKTLGGVIFSVVVILLVLIAIIKNIW